ncbi:hypothetical protein BHE74_00056939 [Ensete ventricosum]|nr:hypothetical protein BHE74_00056939 [Ensete ventricosum]
MDESGLMAVAAAESQANEVTAKLEEVRRGEAEALEKVKTWRMSSMVSYEFGYKIALTHFRTKYSRLEVEEDPYTTLPEDDNIPMEVEVPFDDSDPTVM